MPARDSWHALFNLINWPWRMPFWEFRSKLRWPVIWYNLIFHLKDALILYTHLRYGSDCHQLLYSAQSASYQPQLFSRFPPRMEISTFDVSFSVTVVRVWIEAQWLQYSCFRRGSSPCMLLIIWDLGVMSCPLPCRFAMRQSWKRQWKWQSEPTWPWLCYTTTHSTKSISYRWGVKSGF